MESQDSALSYTAVTIRLGSQFLIMTKKALVYPQLRSLKVQWQRPGSLYQSLMPQQLHPCPLRIYLT